MHRNIWSVIVIAPLVVSATSADHAFLASDHSADKPASVEVDWTGTSNALPTKDRTIHDAVEAGNEEGVRLLLDGDPTLVDARDVNQRTPLHTAAGGGHAEIAELLLALGADVDAQNQEGHTSLHEAALGQDFTFMELLIRHSADLEVLDAYGRTALHLVARQTGRVDLATLLLEAGADVDVLEGSNWSALDFAVWRGFADMVDLFLDSGARLPASRGMREATASFAAQHGLTRYFGLLVDSGVDLTAPDRHGGTLLHSAASGGAPGVAETMLSEGLNIAQTDRFGWTPLHYAAQGGHLEMVRTLISRGAPTDIRTLAGDSPHNVAARGQKHAVSELLAERGADTGAPRFPRLLGPLWGQAPPGPTPTLFAADIVSSNRFEHGSITFTDDGREAFWSSSDFHDESGGTISGILTSSLGEAGWSPPRTAPFSQSGRIADDVPFFQPGGQRLFFLSTRTVEGEEEVGERIWYVDRTADGWGEPVLIEGGPNELSTHWQFSVAAHGNIYFNSGDPGGAGGDDLYVSRYDGVRWTSPENLGTSINSEHNEFSSFISPDESYLISSVMGSPDNIGGIDLYVSFKDDSGAWTPLVNLGPEVNSGAHDLCPFITADGRYLSFNSHRGGEADVFWMDAAVIEDLRPATTSPERIHYLVNEGDLEAVRTLLAADPTLVSARDDVGDTPLHIAAERENVSLVALLLDAGAPRPLHENGISRSWPQSSHLARAKPWAWMPQRR